MLTGLRITLDGHLETVTIDNSAASDLIRALHRAIGCELFDSIALPDHIGVSHEPTSIAPQVHPEPTIFHTATEPHGHAPSSRTTSTHILQSRIEGWGIHSELTSRCRAGVRMLKLETQSTRCLETSIDPGNLTFAL